MSDPTPRATDPADQTQEPDRSADPEAEYRSAVAHLIEIIEREGDGQTTEELRQAAAGELARLDGSPKDDRSEAGESVGEENRSPAELLVDALHRFETDHPSLTKAVNDVSHYLSGLGI